MTDRKQWLRLIAALCAALLVLAACGGGDGDNGTGTETEEQGIASTDDLTEEHKIAVQRATTGAFWAEENLASKGVQLVSFEKAPQMYQALQAGQVDGVLNDLPVSLDAIEGKEGVEVVEQIDTGEEYAIAVSKDNPGLTEALNGAMAEIVADGTFEEIYTKYFPDQEVPDYSDIEGDVDADFETVKEGALTVGSDIPYPPFEMEEGGELTGYDVELVRALADKLGLENTDDHWISTDFGTIFQQLASGTKFDIVVAAVTAYAPEGSPAAETVAERRKIVDFTVPYYPSLQSLTVSTSQ
ncbi:MAG: transporter substrate-binding domain-containing protein [Actinobacteria bacterium]|nr:transporter substrate-binding domain-containing protein [Actinomycetota bacterium]